MTDSISKKSLVLYADDDLDDVQLISDAFSIYHKSVELICFGNGADLVAFMGQQESFAPTPCLVILDVNMPVMSGKEALVALRSEPRFSKVPVVLFTTSNLPSERQFAQAYDAGFIVKPLHYEQMRIIAEQMVDHCDDDIKKRLRGDPPDSIY
jgi:CheY-like chemotaxis protein